ncbi:MAG TPA: hypothetical protein VFP05_09800 [Thermomicrobiales bacterium]|nr:hypothetical protein [Thermomicrobiales bacterium]
MSWFRETMLKAEAKAGQLESWVKDSVSGAADRTRETAGNTVDRTNEFVGDYQDTTDSMLRRIPGYSGYKDKEQARDSDRALRNDIAQQLDQNATRVEAMQRAAANDRNVARVTELDPVVQGFRNAANVVRSLSYGYGGLFSDKPVDEVALAQLRLFDEGLLVKVTALTTAVEGLEAGSSGDAGVIAKEIAKFKAGLDLRNSVITEGRPAKPVKILEPSAATERAFAEGEQTTAEPVALPDVSLGDAMSILGDDHLVEALIDVDTGTSIERFIRLDNKPQMWLWVSTDPTHTPHRLLGADEPAGVDWSETAGKAKISVPDERTRSGPAIIRTGRTADSGVVQLDIDRVIQNFTASDIHADDIETYQAK